MDTSLLLTILTVLILVGCIAGAMSGLLGISGAFIIVPVGTLCLVSLGVSEEIAMRAAIATSLFIILPTAAAGASVHFRRGNIHTKTALITGLSGFLFSCIGSAISEHLSAGNLSLLFGAVYMTASAAVFISARVQSRKPPQETAYYALLFGMAVGLIAGMTGIGGGVILIPLFMIFLCFPAPKAIGTATAVIVMTSLGGIAGYIFGGAGVENLPPYSIGYLNVPLLICIGLPAVPAALSCASAAPRVGAGRLRVLFLTATFLIGAYYVFIRSGCF